jgi:hypothetical protein
MKGRQHVEGKSGGKKPLNQKRRWIGQTCLQDFQNGVALEGMGVPPGNHTAVKPSMNEIRPDMKAVGHIVVQSTWAVGVAPGQKDREQEGGEGPEQDRAKLWRRAEEVFETSQHRAHGSPVQT